MITLRKTRDQLGVTQDQLEERSGVSRETISRIERDETADPRTSTMKALANALGVGIDDLVHDEEGNPAAAGRGKRPGARTAAGKRSASPVHQGE